MSAILENLREQYTQEEMIPVHEATSVKKIKAKLSERHRIVFTHYNLPVMVGMEPDVFNQLIKYIEELERELEEYEVRRIVKERLADPIPEDRWLSHEEFFKGLQELTRRAKPRG